jgi:hypothetical protein
MICAPSRIGHASWAPCGHGDSGPARPSTLATSATLACRPSVASRLVLSGTIRTNAGPAMAAETPSIEGVFPLGRPGVVWIAPQISLQRIRRSQPLRHGRLEDYRRPRGGAVGGVSGVTGELRSIARAVSAAALALTAFAAHWRTARAAGLVNAVAASPYGWSVSGASTSCRRICRIMCVSLATTVQLSPRDTVSRLHRTRAPAVTTKRLARAVPHTSEVRRARAHQSNPGCEVRGTAGYSS